MRKELIAVIIQEGSKLVSEVIKTSIHRKPPILEMPVYHEPPEPELPVEKPPSFTPEVLPEENRATSIKSGCIPCSIGHVGTCSGLLKEAVRFARDEGITSAAVIERTGICLDELNAMERVDMTPAMLKDLPLEEKEIADRVLSVSRQTRHAIESLASPEASIDVLNELAATLETTRKDIWQDFVRVRTNKMDISPEQKELVEKTILNKIDEIENKTDEVE